MAGLVPAIRAFPDFTSDKRVIQVIPVGIHCVQEPHLPCAWPMLDRLLALNGVADVIEMLMVDKHFQTVTF
jgi:hypothetical protein